ncbi:type II toxin-antitoxin system VapC family toxin [Fibrella aquatica]|uniref:type II toxin-antitoxin system VapC family toxin n=1 Tax=Fibrella aquatica TaxID=3242487 RepID=UPI00352039D5
MKLFDSNLVIYSWLNSYSSLRPLLLANDVFISAISKVETLGYHKLPLVDKLYFEALFDTANVLLITEAIVDKATELRQLKKMSVGDCIIAATALQYGFVLFTNNVKDFMHIPSLTVVNPLEMKS